MLRLQAHQRHTRTGARHTVNNHRPAAPGLTLIECVLAMLVLSTATLGILTTTAAGHSHLRQADQQLRAVRMAEQLHEEIVSRPYTNGGAGRANWAVEDFDGFAEAPGALEDFSGDLLESGDQVFARSVGVTHATQSLAGLDGIARAGVLVEITVDAPDGQRWVITRFIPEPYWP